MLISRPTVGSEPLLSRAAVERVFRAVKRPIKARPVEAVFNTLDDLTTELMHRIYGEYPSEKSVEAAAKAFSTFREFFDANPFLADPLPTPPDGYLAAQARWFERMQCELGECRRGKGRPQSRVLAHGVPNLLALYAIAFRDDPHPGNADNPGPCARFVEAFAAETMSALREAKFPSLLEREKFLAAWCFPKASHRMLRGRRLGPEPLPGPGVADDLPPFLREGLVGAWGSMVVTFKQRGGIDPYRPSSV